MRFLTLSTTKNFASIYMRVFLTLLVNIETTEAAYKRLSAWEIVATVVGLLLAIVLGVFKLLYTR